MHGHRFADAPFGPGFGRGRGRPAAGARRPRPPVERTEVAGWFAGRLPDDWFTGPVELTIDRDEITVVGTLRRARRRRGRPGRRPRRPDLPVPRGDPRSSGWRSPTPPRSATAGRSPGAPSCGDDRELFTNLSMPVMTRLRQRGAARPGHPGRRRGRPVPVGGAGLGGPAGRPARRRVADRAAVGDGVGGGGSRAGPERRLISARLGRCPIRSAC